MPKKKQLNNNENNQKTINQISVNELSFDEIIVSEFSIQGHRRRRFKDEDLAELAVSIKEQGLINPITVRPISDNKNEIVAGERRFLASGLAGLKSIPCFVKELSDEAALEIQMQENLQRIDIDPLDEAFSYKYLADEKNYSIEDLAVKFGKNEKFIRGRLKLNELIPKGIEAVEAGELPLGHAAEIAKYPVEAQTEIIKKNYAYKWGDKDSGLIPFAKFKEVIKEKISLSLKNAPFAPDDKQLHPDGLTCGNCSQRTGFEPVLFDEDFKDNDYCLNKKCFESKTFANLTIKRAEIAEKLPNPEKLKTEELVKKVPFVSDGWGWHGIVKEFPGAEFLSRQEFLDQKDCEFAIESVVIDGKRKGQIVFVCNTEKCPVHDIDDDKETENDKPSDWQLQRWEKDLRINTNNRTRSKILFESLKKFDESAFWEFDQLIEKLLFVLFSENEYKIRNNEYINPLFEAFAPGVEEWADDKNIERFIKNLTRIQRSKFLFLLTFCQIDYSSYEIMPQNSIKNIAADLTGLNYDLVFAETFCEVVKEDNEDEDLKPDDSLIEKAEAYLEAVKAGNSPEIPKIYLTEEMELDKDDDDDDDDLELDDDDELELEDDLDENDLGETSQG